jgi:murein DD-endopeptidase MepM/ murein hydrolase activator NlpD
MGPGWRVLVKTAAITATLTTAFWFMVAAWWLQRDDGPGPASRPSVPPPATELLMGRSEPDEEDRRETSLIVPVAGVRRGQLVDTYSQARAAGARRHDAIDITAPRGTPVIAAAAGRVEKLFLSKDGGNTVYVRSPDARRIYYYAHLDHYAAGLREGLALHQGAPVGTVGSTGNANPAAPHLHFAVWMTTPERKWWEQAIALNPFPLLTAR